MTDELAKAAAGAGKDAHVGHRIRPFAAKVVWLTPVQRDALDDGAAAADERVLRRAGGERAPRMVRLHDADAAERPQQEDLARAGRAVGRRAAERLARSPRHGRCG